MRFIYIILLLVIVFLISPAFAEIEGKIKGEAGLVDYSNKGFMLYVPYKIASFSQAPILICLPGYGIKAKQDINNWSFCASKRGYLVLSIDVDYKNMNSLAGVDNLYSRITDIVSFLSSQYPVSKNKLYIVGTSAGGMMSIALALRYPGSFRAVGIVSGGRLSFPARQNLNNAKENHFYMVHGEDDESIPIGEFHSTRKSLEKNGAVIEYKTVRGGRHTLSSGYYTETVNWIASLNE